jgi:hypothetical protein
VTHGCSDHVAVVASLSRFITGRFFEDAGRGEDVDHAYVQVQSTF